MKSVQKRLEGQIKLNSLKKTVLTIRILSKLLFLETILNRDGNDEKKNFLYLFTSSLFVI